MNLQEHWTNQLGLRLLKQGALTYIISDGRSDYLNDWGEFSKTNQKTDMVVLYKNHVAVVEFKETSARRRKDISFKQIERYYHICKKSIYRVDFWVYVYWKQYNIITGVKMNNIENLNIFAIDSSGDLEFYASIGLNPETRIRKKVDIVLNMDNLL